MIKEEPSGRAHWQLIAVQNWLDELRRLVPTSNPIGNEER
jgi:hypothetical protein